MEPYERNISLKTIWLTIIRRYIDIILVFIPIALASLVVTKFVMVPSYQSTLDVMNNAAITEPVYLKIKSYMTNKEIYYTVAPETEGGESRKVYVYQAAASNLLAAGKKHSNGAAITADEIYAKMGISSWTSGKVSITFNYSSTDTAITQPVLDEVVPLLFNVMKENSITTFTAGKASASKKVSKENTYLLIGLAAGFVVACGLAFIDEIVSDEVYDAEDIRLLGADGFSMKASAK